MVHNHMVWIETVLGKGDLYPEFHGRLTDFPTHRDITFTESVELVSSEFPPRTAIKRPIY